MKTFTINDIRSWKPCYNPMTYLPEGWSGTCVDILNNENIPHVDRLWCVLRAELVSERTMRLFAVWCYRQTLKFVTNPDSRSIEAASVAERFANGQATAEEMSAARSSAWSAVWSAARSAAELAAWSAAEAAWSAARTSAAEAAAGSAAAWSSAESARAAQKNKLIEMILEENK